MKREAAPIESVLKNLIKELGKKDRLTEEDMMAAWTDVVGQQAAGHSRPISFRRSRLIVNVDSSGWLYNLTLKKKNIITELAGKLKGRRLKDIRLRIGEIGEKNGQGKSKSKR